MKFVSNLPDSKHTPYEVIEAEPHPSTVLQFFRASDYVKAASFQLFPLGLYAWEVAKPSMHPRNRAGVLLIQIPLFAVSGLAFAAQGVLFRFWGWRENAREVEMYKALDLKPKSTKWSELDW